MTKLTDSLWIGDSKDMYKANLTVPGINAMLNVAHDLQGWRGWSDGLLYAQCGLIDGPGNRIAVYHAAILMLASLIADGRKVLVCCHDRGRSLAVCLMYLHLTTGNGWDGCLLQLSERIDDTLPEPHPEHKKAFNRLDWRLLTSVTEG